MKRLTTQSLPAVGGGVASLAINKVIPSSINPKYVGLGKIAIGILAPELMPKSAALESASLGWLGHAASEVAGDFIPALTAPKTAGVGATEYRIDEDIIEGVDDDTLTGVEKDENSTY